MSESQGKQHGFWGFMQSALGFFAKVLDTVKKDPRLAILWGFGVLLLVLLVATLFIARDIPPIGKVILAALIVVVLTFLFVYTLPRTETPKPSVSGEMDRIQAFTSDDIVFDFSHNQESWQPSPSLGAGFRRVKGIATGLGWNAVSMDKAGWLTSVPPRMGALVVVCPYHRELEKGEINSIIKYVSSNGKLLVLGYFCSLHHGTNLNDLMDGLGITFKYDLVLPLPPYQSEGNYWRPEVIDPKYIVRVSAQNTDMKSVSDTLLKNVNTIGLHSSCSLDVTKPQGESVVLHTGQQQLVWEPQGIIYSSDNRRFWERIGRYTPSREKRSPLVAVTTFDKGKIAVIGSWTVFHDETIAQTPDNSQLFENLLRWFKG